MLFFRKKSGLTLSTYLTAVDGRVIARQGETVEDALLNRLAASAPPAAANLMPIAETDVYNHLKLLTENPRYHFITSRGQKNEELLALIGSVQLNQLLLEELNWLKRFEYHYHHCLAISLMVCRMSLDFFHDKNQARLAAACALTHDVGISRVPESVLNKLSSLSDEEWGVLREHPIYSYLLLTYYQGNPIDSLARVGFEHHENLLGTGYPRGIRQENIISHCIHLADCYDALISARPFRPAFSLQEAWQMVSEGVEARQLDPAVFVLLNSYLEYLN